MRLLTILLLKLFILFLPLGVCLCSYLCYDPFKVIYTYDNLLSPSEIVTNRDFVSTEMFFRQEDRYHYDSFIFGNSRSLGFLASDWTRWIDSTAVFHFDASSESLFGIAGKLRLLDREGVPIRNALFVLDSAEIQAVTDRRAPVYLKHPAVSESSWAAFHVVFFRGYVTPSFLVPYLYHKATGRISPWFPSPFQENQAAVDPVTNDLRLTVLEQQIAADCKGYYERRKRDFYRRVPGASVVSDAVIAEKQRSLLSEMAGILDKHKTAYRLVISPLYDQKHLHPDDLAVLHRVFGAGRVFDFSGVNEFTSDFRNYYEESHYRPHVGREIMKRMYQGRPRE